MTRRSLASAGWIRETERMSTRHFWRHQFQPLAAWLVACFLSPIVALGIRALLT